MMGGEAPFGAEAYDLGVARLRPVTEGDATVLGAALAAIDPWRRMGFPAKALSGYLTRDDPTVRRFAIWTGGAAGGAAGGADGSATAPALSGVVSVRDPWLRGPYLEVLGLLPHAQGQGVGAAVMGWFENEAQTGKRAMAATNLWVLCSDFNAGGLAFYKRHGFEEVAPLDGMAGPGFTEILLRKRLDI